jgi:hypothetical protein
MAVCAIVVGRQRHTTDSQSPQHQVPSPQTQKPPSKAFYQAAIAAFPADLSRAQGFEYKRAKVLMAIACIQYGAILEHQTHLGEYVVLACNDGYHDESRWERSLNEIERQERRRLVSKFDRPASNTLMRSFGRHTPLKSFPPSHGTGSYVSENVRAMFVIQPKCTTRILPKMGATILPIPRSSKDGTSPPTCIGYSSILLGGLEIEGGNPTEFLQCFKQRSRLLPTLSHILRPGRHHYHSSTARRK